jgi:hypothetical protein
LTQNPPPAFVEWEKALCCHFLGARGDASAIRSLEITPTTLAEAISEETPVAPGEARRRFLEAFEDSERIFDALEHGQYVKLDRIGVPGCFTFLVLTLLADSLIDETLIETQFRPKLAEFLGVERSFSNLSGVASMWGDLARWLDREIKKGKPFRPLHLPDPGGWRQIGHTARLSFPSRRDRQLMRNFLDEHEGILASPKAFLEAFRNVAAGSKASWGMREAFAEFHHDFLAGRRTLGEHRFWMMVLAIAQGRDKSAPPSEVTVEMSRDQDEVWAFMLAVWTRDNVERVPVQSLAAAVAEADRRGPNALSRSLAKGFLVFRQIGHSRWRTAPDIGECVGRIMMGCSSDAAVRIGDRLGPFVGSGSWLVTREPASIGAAEAALARLGVAAADHEGISTVSVRDGVTTGGAWLGRRPFLPVIIADKAASGGDAILRVVPVGCAAACVSCFETEGLPGTYRLESNRTVDGQYIVSPALTGSDGPAWSRRLTFSADAFVHMPPKDVSAYLRIDEWEGAEERAFAIGPVEPTWDDIAAETEDLVEAIYAGGRSGWGEAELVALARQAHGERINPWDAIRSCQDSSLLLPTLRPEWKGRIWRLVPPTLVALNSPRGRVVVVSGCVGARLVDEFRRAAEGAGGVPFRRRGVSRFAPALLGCVGGDIETIAGRLGWKSASPVMPGARRLAFATTTRSVERHFPASWWSWSRRRFLAVMERPSSTVTLTRWAHPGGTDHDIYVVRREKREWRLLSRTAAIALAHCLSGISLFGLRDKAIVRLANEGALPDAIAAAVRLRALTNPGPDDRGLGYHYPAAAADLAEIGRLVPALVAEFKDSAGVSRVAVVPSVRHSGGRARLIWREGRLSTTDRS